MWLTTKLLHAAKLTHVTGGGCLLKQLREEKEEMNYHDCIKYYKKRPFQYHQSCQTNYVTNPLLTLGKWSHMTILHYRNSLLLLPGTVGWGHRGLKGSPTWRCCWAAASAAADAADAAAPCPSGCRQISPPWERNSPAENKTHHV